MTSLLSFHSIPIVSLIPNVEPIVFIPRLFELNNTIPDMSIPINSALTIPLNDVIKRKKITMRNVFCKSKSKYYRLSDI